MSKYLCLFADNPSEDGTKKMVQQMENTRVIKPQGEIIAQWKSAEGILNRGNEPSKKKINKDGGLTR